VTAITAGARPQRLEQGGPETLIIHWDDGHECRYAVRQLRMACPCAGCVDEWTGEQTLTEQAVPTDVRPNKIEPVGLYALSFDWSDGHSTGIYTFERLAEMCPCKNP
jgi:DUF971 family protein